MIDFRYHLVSLVSVFLALAVGIVLGAGPLKQPIGESLQSQVDALRTDRDNLRTTIEADNANLQKQNDFVTASAPELIGGTLKGTKVGLITAPNAAADQVEDVTKRIKEAGGTLAFDASFVTDTLSLKDAKDFLVQIRTLVPDLSTDDSSAIKQALVIALTGKASTIKDAKARTAAEKKAGDLFTAFVDSGRLRADADRAQAQSFIIVDDERSQLAEDTQPSAEATDNRDKRTLVTDWVTALTKDSTAVVVAGDAGSAQTGLVSILRKNKSQASTVDGLGLGAGAVITVRALAAADSGARGDYGFASTADSILPAKPAPSTDGKKAA